MAVDKKKYKKTMILHSGAFSVASVSSLTADLQTTVRPVGFKHIISGHILLFVILVINSPINCSTQTVHNFSKIS